MTGRGFRANLIFFMLQPLGILFEEQVIAAGRHAGLRNRPLWRVLGYAWTSVWMVFSFRLLCEDVSAAGMFWFPWRPWDVLGMEAWMNG